MQVTSLEIQGLLLIVPKRFHDSRGYFTELYSANRMSEIGINETFVQDNLSRSAKAGTVRGLHYQTPPHAQAKLIRVNHGRVLDVAVDLRASSPSYGKHVAIELSAENGEQLFIPAGFAHGFCTLEADTELNYKVSNYYAPQADTGILWSDPELQINWPVKPDSAIVSDKDTRLPLLNDVAKVF